MPLSSRDLVHKSDKMEPYIRKLNSIEILLSELQTGTTGGGDLLVENERIHIPLNRNGLEQVTKIQLDKNKLQRYLDILEFESVTKPVIIQLDESKVMEYLKILNDMNRTANYPDNLVFKSRIKSMKGPSPIVGLNAKIRRDNDLIKGTETPLVFNIFEPREKDLSYAGVGKKNSVKESFNAGKDTLNRNMHFDNDDEAYIHIENDYGELVNDKLLSTGEINEDDYEDYEDMHEGIDREQEKNEEIMRNYYIGNDIQDVLSPFNDGVSLPKNSLCGITSGKALQQPDPHRTFSSGEENGSKKTMTDTQKNLNVTYIDKPSNENIKFSRVKHISSHINSNSFFQDNIVEENEGIKIASSTCEAESMNEKSFVEINQFTNMPLQIQQLSQTVKQAYNADIQRQNILDKTNTGEVLTNHGIKNNPEMFRSLINSASLMKNRQMNKNEGNGHNGSQFISQKHIDTGIHKSSSNISSPEILTANITSNMDSIKGQNQIFDNLILIKDPINSKTDELRTYPSGEVPGYSLKPNISTPKLIEENYYVNINSAINLKSRAEYDAKSQDLRNIQQKLPLFESSIVALSSTVKPSQLIEVSVVRSPNDVLKNVITSTHEPNLSISAFNEWNSPDKLSQGLDGNNNNRNSKINGAFKSNIKIENNYHENPNDSSSTVRPLEDSNSSKELPQETLNGNTSIDNKRTQSEKPTNLLNSKDEQMNDNSVYNNPSSMNELKPTIEYQAMTLSPISNLSKILNEGPSGEIRLSLEGNHVQMNNSKNSHEVERLDSQNINSEFLDVIPKQNSNHLPIEKETVTVGKNIANSNVIDQQSLLSPSVLHTNIKPVTISFDSIETDKKLSSYRAKENTILAEYSQPKNITYVPYAWNTTFIRHNADSNLKEIPKIKNLENTKNGYMETNIKKWRPNLFKYNLKSSDIASNEALRNSSWKYAVFSSEIGKNVHPENQTFEEVAPLHLEKVMNNANTASDLSSIFTRDNYAPNNREINRYRPTKPPFMYDEYYERVINQLKNAKPENTERGRTNEKEILTILNNNLAHIHIDKGVLYKIIAKALTSGGDQPYIDKHIEEKHYLNLPTAHEEEIQLQQLKFGKTPSNVEPIYPRAIDKWKEKNHYSKRRSIEDSSENSSESYKRHEKQEYVEKTQDVNILFPSNG